MTYKNQVFLDAVQRGETIQWRFTDYQRKTDEWMEFVGYTTWMIIDELRVGCKNVEYRIKPKEQQYTAVWIAE